MKDPKALFLGPYSENQTEFRKLLNLVFDDIIQWRRNYHPTDDRIIKPEDKEIADWKNTSHSIERELDILLGEMKRSIPFHNPRFIGHMHSDLLIPSLLGYFIGQLYNQNNVVGESSPVTTEKEIRFIEYLCKMVHYPLHEYADQNGKKPNTIYSAGHLTGGGTAANLESVWVARNVKYFPLSLKLLLKQKSNDSDWETILNNVGAIPVKTQLLADISAKELFDLSPQDVFTLRDKLLLALKSFVYSSAVSIDAFTSELNKLSVRALGVYGIHESISNHLHERLSLPVLVLPQSRHYSWEKAMDILGLGSANIKYVKVDVNFKMDVTDFEMKCSESEFILMAITVVGTTEEGVIDPVADIVACRARSGKGFWLHIDAAYGGYYAAAFNTADTNSIDISNIEEPYQELKDWLETSLEDIKMIKEADSITIDPHKLGYVPYATGVILYKDDRSKPFIEKKAPYLSSGNEADNDPTHLYLGGSSIEGSRSGASALACYLSSKILPADQSGYGNLMLGTFANARVFQRAMLVFNAAQTDDSLKISAHPLYDSLTNIVCYGVGLNGIKLTASLYNKLNDALYKELCAEKNKLVNDYKFIVSKTTLEFDPSANNPGYAKVITSFLDKFGIDAPDSSEKYELVLLRSSLINPMLDQDARHRIFNEYFQYLRNLVNKILPKIILEDKLIKNEFKRIRVLWVENQERVEALKNAILSGKGQSLDISRFVDLEFKAGVDESTDLTNYDLFIVDMNLNGTQHDEWKSGIELIRKIRSAKKQPPILVYSQFLNPAFVSRKPELESIDYKTVVSNYLNHNMGIKDKNLISKTFDRENYYTKENPVEMKDLDLIIQKLALNIL